MSILSIFMIDAVSFPHLGLQHTVMSLFLKKVGLSNVNSIPCVVKKRKEKRSSLPFDVIYLRAYTEVLSYGCARRMR